MIRSHNKMIYYDIHTHKQRNLPDEKAIVAVDIRKSEKLPEGYYSAGIHPWGAATADLQILQQWAVRPEVVAIGETGLDKMAIVPMSIQKEVFTAHVALAGEVNKPLIIHCVRAWEELLSIRKAVSSHIPWIIHGFRGNGELARQLLRHGFYLSFGIHFHPEAVHAAWEAQHLFAETDMQPSSVRNVYAGLATELSVTPEMLSQEMETHFRNWKHPLAYHHG